MWATRTATAVAIAALGLTAPGLPVAAAATITPVAPTTPAAGSVVPRTSLTDWGHGGPEAWMPGYTSTQEVVQQSLSSSAARAAEAVTPSVVNIDTVVGYGVGEAAGTGIVLSSDGLVLTNHHVVEGATSITGTVVGTGTTYTATVLGYDPATDIAVLELTGASGLPVATVGDSSTLDLGEMVVGVGNAGGQGGDPTAVEGVVTALEQTITATDSYGANAETLTGLIATDADVQAGQSGGPLVDGSGTVVGVDVAASVSYGGSSTDGYAIPIEDALGVAEQIVAGQSSSTVHIGGTPFLGVHLGMTFMPGFGGQPGFAATAAGVAVAGVVEGSAAESSGLTSGDTITSIDGTQVRTADELTARIGEHSVGDRITIVWLDSLGAQHQATVQLGVGPVG